MRPARPPSSKTAASSARRAGGAPSYPTTRFRNAAGGGALVLVLKVAPLSFFTEAISPPTPAAATQGRGPPEDQLHPSATAAQMYTATGVGYAACDARRSRWASPRQAITSSDGNQYVVGGGRDAGGT